jgi:hypothetical protein
MNRLNLGNACYHSVQNFLTCLLSKNEKIEICRTVILSVCMYVCMYVSEMWSLTL